MPTYRDATLIAKPSASGQSAHLLEPLATVAALLRARGIRVAADTRTAELVAVDRVVEWADVGSNADLVVAVGGDGTLLGAARQVAAHRVPIIGINLGRLGFLTDVPANAIEPMLSAVLAGEASIEPRLLLNAAVVREGAAIFEAVALNDVVVSRGAMGSMIEFSVEVNGEFVYSVRADGLIIATPTGSTAYSLSAGGPILHPSLPAIALVPISPHTLSNRPVAIPSSSAVEVKLIRGDNARVNFDVQSFFDPKPDDIVRVQAHPDPVLLLHPEGYRYFSMLRTKLHWYELT